MHVNSSVLPTDIHRKDYHWNHWRIVSFLLKNCFHAKHCAVQCELTCLLCCTWRLYNILCAQKKWISRHFMYLLLKECSYAGKTDDWTCVLMCIESETFLMLHIYIQAHKTNVSRSTVMTQEGICISWKCESSVKNSCMCSFMGLLYIHTEIGRKRRSMEETSVHY